MTGAMAEDGLDRRVPWLLGAIILLGFALRVAGAQGSLWLDEAWSAVMANGVGTPLGIVLNINHDNNHHLNSLWLQLVGPGAEPMVARALSIVCGTAAIWVAWAIGRRRSVWVGLIGALLFAVSPILVTLGSEARGYAPMTLAFLVAVLIADRWLAGETARRPAFALSLCFLLGALAQLTMVIGFCAIAGWLFLALRKRSDLLQAARDAALLLLPSALVLAAVIAIVFGAAVVSETGWQLGDYSPFAWTKYFDAIATLTRFTLGVPAALAWIAIFVPLLALLAPRLGVWRASLYLLLVLAFPLLLAVIQPGNVGHSRYLLVVGVAALLLIVETAWLGIEAEGWRRWLAAGTLAGITLGSLVQDVDLIRNQRGDPGAAIRALAARAPQGTTVIIHRPAALAVLQVAAQRDGYRLDIIENRRCAQAPFLFIDYLGNEVPPEAPTRCGQRYSRIAGGRTTGFSGTHWALYARAP